MVERGDFFCHAHRIMRGHGVAHDPGVETLGVLANEQAEHARVIVDLEAFDLEVMLRLTVSIEAQLVRLTNVAPDLLEEALVQILALPGHPLLNLMTPSDDTRLHQVEFHDSSPYQNLLSTLMLIERLVGICQRHSCSKSQ